ncbi:MAG: hypothetical protein A9Z00_13800 [Thermobacillus sp. ZCTH02-B1]|uniref:DUF1292 domain-containing protein n=1 Tax=Thermobacillus sp. ZCTH02-B1 TaxID=1858795 RepID=UPI000B563F6B|nr:DUF1292 domain-containing protein [Thermobacillus sp. ZCTH02-B1]OUM96480.1 MAG: hypothetical protein A9Z00_13800 [Thermobacillus sp. ZCTH02-B1]
MSEHLHDHAGGRDFEHDDEQDAVFILTDEDGREHEMIMVYTFDAEDSAYAVLLDRNDPEADGVIFRIEEENGEMFLVGIEDDEEWDRVVKVYEEIAGRESEG